MTRVEAPPERALHFTTTVPAPKADVWEAWTTEAGVESFFAPDCRIELEPGGAYETYFDPTVDPGSRGGEGNRVLAVQPEDFLSVTWNAPPRFPSVRDQRTVVFIRLTSTGDDRTEVTLTHVGWGEGDEWEEAYEYFDRAWGETVLPRLERRFEVGPIDWETREF